MFTGVKRGHELLQGAKLAPQELAHCAHREAWRGQHKEEK